MKHSFSRKAKRPHPRLRAALGVCAQLLLALSFFLALNVRWLFTTWSDLNVDELMYHLSVSLSGTGSDQIVNYVKTAVVPFVIAAALWLLFWHLVRKDADWKAVKTPLCLMLAAVLVLLSFRITWSELKLSRWLRGQTTESTFIEEWYTEARTAGCEFPDRKRNLIYIYLESMEVTYADTASGGAFEDNLIPELTALAQENEDFSGTDDTLDGCLVTPGTTWTMGGMFAQTTGLPLLVSMGNNTMGTQDTFFPTIDALGDLLENEGYKNVFMLGSLAEFGARDLYFTEHGQYEIQDYQYALDNGLIPSDYYEFWGYEDRKLFDFAKDELTELAASDQPFNLTLLTVDTHFEDGYLCPLCDDTYGDNQYANVMACSSRQVSEFVQWIQQQDFYENTTIILVGDHTTMDNDFCDDVPADYNRSTYTCYINSAVTPETDTRRTYTTLDMFPTTLAALGVTIPGNRLGIGTNLFSSESTLAEIYGYDTLCDHLWEHSGLMDTLACVNYDDAELIQREDTYEISADLTVTDNGDGTFTVNIDNLARSSDYVERVRVTVAPQDNPEKSAEFAAERTKTDGRVHYEVVVDPSQLPAQGSAYTITVDGLVGTGNAYPIGTLTYPG